MRTTLELTPEAWHHAKAVARERNESLGKVVSEFILKKPEPPIEEFRTSRVGLPVWSSDRPVTSEDVKAILEKMDEEELEGYR